MSDFPKLSEHLHLNEFGTHIKIPKQGNNKWYRLIYFDVEDQHLEFFDEEENVILSSNELTPEDIHVMHHLKLPEFEKE